MITQPAKVFLPLVGLGVVMAIVYATVTGDHGGITLLFGLAAVAFLAAIAVTSARQSEFAPATAEETAPPELKPAPATRLPGGPGWPAIGGIAAGLLALAFLIGGTVAVAGLIVALIAAVGWLASASADRTGRSPDLYPIGIPVLGFFAIGSLMFFMSRILLAVPEQASTFIALAVATLILVVASFIALKPAVSSKTVMTGLVIGGLLFAGGGLVAAAAGPREIEHEGGEQLAGQATVQIVADDIAFDLQEFELTADQPAVIEFDNDEPQPHNVAIYTAEDATQIIFQGDVIVGPLKTQYRFTAPGPGSYFFRCDIHPNMKGTVKVA